MASTPSRTSSRCDACRGDIGLRQASFTSECAHNFHLGCVSGAAACPVCAAKWSDTLVAVPAGSPASPFSFASPSFGQTPSSRGRPFSMLAGRPPAKQNPFWLGHAPPAPRPSSCTVCQGAIGRGQATVTSECKHTIHLRCISGSVCPVCSARWRDEVTVTPSQPRPLWFPLPTNFNSPPSTPSSSPEPPMPRPPISAFNDDEPVVEPPPLDDGWEVVQEATNNGVLVLTTHCEHPAVARDAAQENFAVLVQTKAPDAAAEASELAPLDVVTVLDVSDSMSGSKLGLLKQAMGFFIDDLGPGDRLSIVTFSCRARRIIRLTRMTDGGKALAKDVVESLTANGSTNIGDGIRVAAEVLDGRRHGNAVSGVILFSDGQDNHTLRQGGDGPFGGARSYADLVPQSLSARNRQRALVEGSRVRVRHRARRGGDARHRGGGGRRLLLHPEPSGRSESRVDADRAASVDVGELYADEERRFLLLLEGMVESSKKRDVSSSGPGRS
ncbi:E3 ubiquitin-protein ligase WAV3-like [Panicum virgatum]|uniref:E3 ubiquitin-protein ligase WAV3-like n=1 Tax=Panicum virgatum TaxID=38727 RepID=UPI0019D67258|nr:E3 ubiquitin-protein ligase WAV3-like [Panicum virgatum]